MEGQRPPEDNDISEMEAQRQPEAEQRTGRVALRVVDPAESTEWRPADNRNDAPYLVVDEETAVLIHRRRYRAVIKVKTGVAAVHGGLTALMDARLEGREPATMPADGFIEVNFGVMDDRPRSWDEARLVGNYLMSIVDPIERREPEVAVCLVDTSDIDPYLPEGRRTLR